MLTAAKPHWPKGCSTGVLRKLGRVDHRDAFLDTDSQERARGITIFAKQAVLTLPAADGCGETALTLLDTPGHVDFSAEAERALQVLDYAVLVVSGTDGVQAHTETLWKLLARYRVPTFVFVNKMDLPGADAAVRLRELRGRFGDGCVDFSTAPDPETLALCSEPLMNEVLDTGTPASETGGRSFRCFSARRCVWTAWTAYCAACKR